MKIAVTGSSGMIGSLLCRHFQEKGHKVVRLVRKGSSRDPQFEEAEFLPGQGKVDQQALAGTDVVINLAGANLADKRWTEERKRVIVSSRIDSTSLIVQAIAKLEPKPKVFLSASATGYYGMRDSGEVVDEDGDSGDGFLAEVCRKWEGAAQPAAKAGVRTIILRTGVVLSPEGGALAKMLPIFKLGLGGKLGHGKQMMSWVALEEYPKIVEHLVEREDLEGPVNIVAPQTVSNKEFARALGEALGRPAILPAPGAALKLAFGRQMAEETLLNGVAIEPRKLVDSGYRFEFGEIEATLRHILN